MYHTDLYDQDILYYHMDHTDLYTCIKYPLTYI